jgi:eukaryotic-like serine/threonine-protein kinase
VTHSSALVATALTTAAPISRLPGAIARFAEKPEEERRLGPFVLVKQLGRGGFAPVWLAREVYGDALLRTAAVKLFPLPQGGADSKRQRANIIAEARALCRVEHPNVVRFYSLALDASETLIGLAMEHVAGTPLDRRLSSQRTLRVSETLAVGAAIASALVAVHRVGLVHRDVKPGNVIESPSGYKLIDFGIAGADAEEENVTQDLAAALATTQRVALLAGTPGYMDPECVARRIPADPSSDLYALGATLFECLTGRLPADDVGRVRVDVLEGHSPAPDVVSLAPATPAALSELVDALLAPTRAARPSSAEWVAIRLEQIRHELGGSTRSLPPESVGPFRGLGRFEGADRDLYFGRSSEVAAALETLRGRGLVALLGPSGSGKSSLARAGLLPAVADGALGEWPVAWDIAVATPGVDPRKAVLEALGEHVPDSAGIGAPELVARLAERAQAAGRGTLLFIDQLEELATQSELESARFVVDLLREIGARPLLGVRAVAAARRDMLDPLLAISDLGKALLRGSVLVEPLTESVWSDVIDRALGAYGYVFEDNELRELVLTELGRTSEAMPLVQFALAELWKKRDPARRRLTRAGLTAIGGIDGALGRHAEATLARIRAEPSVPEAALRAVLLALTTARGTRATRTRAELERSVGPIASYILDGLEEARLVARQANRVVLAHDLLITSWASLGDWLAEARDQRLLIEDLERAARIWSADRTHAPLWRRRRLEDAESAARQESALPSEDAMAFLAASRRDERRRRLFNAGIIGAVVLTVTAVAASYLKAVKAEQVKTADALANEQRSRQDAERRTHEVQAAQVRIDELLKNLADSPKKDEIQELQRQIRSGEAPAELARRHWSTLNDRHVSAAPSATAATAPIAAAAKSVPVMKVQSDW